MERSFSTLNSRGVVELDTAFHTQNSGPIPHSQQKGGNLTSMFNSMKYIFQFNIFVQYKRTKITVNKIERLHNKCNVRNI